MALLLSATEAAKVDNQAHVQELSSLIQQAMTESETVSTSQAFSASQLNSQIQNTVHAAIKSEQQAENQVDEQANSKLGFLQKVISLECFFGGSDCLFKDKKSLKAGKITEFAQKQFDNANMDVPTYLAQVK